MEKHSGRRHRTLISARMRSASPLQQPAALRKGLEPCHRRRRKIRAKHQELNLLHSHASLIVHRLSRPRPDRNRVCRAGRVFRGTVPDSGLKLSDEYDRTYATYLQERGERTGNWTERVAKFYRTPYHYRTADSLRQQKLFSGKITMDGQADKPLRPGSNP
ncbi:hypothetical protein NB646_05880 [Oxalobacter aliiformigenes]|uniref:Uncharacterized protein n=1 Tax=Oxalobacter aliiformigenes TaxID=2946593 RepID=A0A9E9LCH1_9BURK|nr:hypothetical protein [Oxalobacter aliiformigenes]WAV90402.1 hypothetical protein NB646_05880 [Oxalobacter aliiformigenes]